MILSKVKWQYALVYLDDVIFYSKSVKQHFNQLGEVLSLMHEAGLTLKLPKCYFFRKSVDYLGHIVSPGKLEVAHRGTEAIRKTLPPRTFTEMKSFIGLCNVYRRFVPNFSRIAKPLDKMVCKDHPKVWDNLTDEQMAAFTELRTRLMQPPVLALPKANKPYTIDTDACDVQIGCVLPQEQ